MALVFGAIAMKSQRDHRRWCERATRCEGVVARVREAQWIEERPETSAGAEHQAAVIVRFRASNGVEYEIDAPEAPMEVGAVVAVAYDPEEPSGGRLVKRTPKIGCAVGLFVIGVILIVAGMRAA